MSDALRFVLEDLAYVVLALAALVAVGGYCLYRYSFYVKFPEVQASYENPNEVPIHQEAFMVLLKDLKNPDTVFEQLAFSVDAFLDSLEPQNLSIEECILLLQLAIKHKNIKGFLVLRLEKCLKTHHAKEGKLFEMLIMDGLKKRS